MRWKIYRRRGRAFRRKPEDWEWKLVKTYSDLQDANKALNVLFKRYDLGDTLKSYQLRLDKED